MIESEILSAPFNNTYLRRVNNLTPDQIDP
jgi:hypothetical protein